MTEFSRDRLQSESVSLLKQLGLNEYEAYVLVHLFELGSGTAKDIADLNNVPRTRVYDSIDSLHDQGLVDIQYTTPRKFTPVSRETALRRLELQRSNTIEQLSELLDQLEPVERRPEEFGVWTVTGRDVVSSRVFEFIEDAQDEIIYMTVDELLTDDHLERLRDAEERDVDIYLAGVSDPVSERVKEDVPSATLFETLWEWSDMGAGSLLITDKQTVLVSVLVDDEPSGETDEVAIWGTGENNSLVVVFRAIFTWRLRGDDVGFGPA